MSTDAFFFHFTPRCDLKSGSIGSAASLVISQSSMRWKWKQTHEGLLAPPHTCVPNSYFLSQGDYVVGAVYLFVCQRDYTKKNAEWDSTKLGGGMRRGPRKSPLNLAARLEKEAASFSCLNSKRSKRMDDLFKSTDASHIKTHVSSKDKSQHCTLSAVMMQGCWDVTQHTRSMHTNKRTFIWSSSHF